MTVRVTTLPNGLRVVTDPMQGVETVSLGMWVGVGTRHEERRMNGVSHLLEHMAFKGTGRRSARDIAEEIEAVGGHLNAYTAREHTAYFAKVLKDDVPLAVDILADILQNSTMDEEELARERDVVLQEIGQAWDTPDDIVFDHFQATAYPDQPIGWPVLGTAEIIRDIRRETLLDYMRGHYTAPIMVLAAAGRVDHERFVELAGAAFGGLPPGDKAATAPASYRGGDFREPRSLEQVHVVLGLEGISFDDPDFYTLGVFSTLLGGGMSSRLFQEVREVRGLAYSIYSFTSAYRDGGLFGIYAGTGERDGAEVVAVICDEVQRAGDTVTEEEIRRAKAQLKSGILMARESTMVRCEQLGQQMLTYGRAIPVAEIVGRIEAVDRAALRRIAGRLTASRPTFAALGPISRVEDFDAIAARLG